MCSQERLKQEMVGRNGKKVLIDHKNIFTRIVSGHNIDGYCWVGCMIKQNTRHPLVSSGFCSLWRPRGLCKGFVCVCFEVLHNIFFNCCPKLQSFRALSPHSRLSRIYSPSANQRPVSRSRDHSWPIRGQYPRLSQDLFSILSGRGMAGWC